MNREIFLRLALNELDGALSPTRMFEIVDQRRISLHTLRKIYDDLITFDEIEFEGRRYFRRKIRKAHYLYPVDEAVAPGAIQSLPDTTPSTELTGESEPTEGIEPCEPLESSVA